MYPPYKVQPLPSMHKAHVPRLLSPSLLGFPRTLSTSALVGFWPRALITSPHWLYRILPSPTRSNSSKASLNSEM
jgi:hypothetical protein